MYIKYLTPKVLSAQLNWIFISYLPRASSFTGHLYVSQGSFILGYCTLIEFI